MPKTWHKFWDFFPVNFKKHPSEAFYENDVLKNLEKFTRNTCVGVIF